MPELRLQDHIKCSNLLDPILLYVKLPAPRFSGTVKVEWSYLSRAIDRDDNLVDSLLSEAPNFEAVSCFFKQSFNIFCHTFWRVTKDGHDFYPRVIHKTLGNEVIHRYNRHLNNRLKQDQRGIKYRSYPVCMFGSVASYVVLGPQF